MGFFLSKKSNLDNVKKSCYHLEAKDAKAMEKLWKIIENDPSYYGWIFSGLFFRNHPQYVKYFHDDNIPDFIEDARIKKKFSAICSIISAVFINYLKRPKQRDYLLGYIAMIHKDMQLSSQDLENFLMNLLDMLAQEHPKLMNNGHRDLTVEYFGGLLRRIEYLMEVYRNNDFRMMERVNDSQKRSYRVKSWCVSPTIYGNSIEFWIAKKEYWQNRLAIWSPLKKDSAFLEKTNKVHGMENIEFNFFEKPSNFVCENKKNLVKTTEYATNDTTNSPNFLQDDVKTHKKKKRHYTRHAMLSNRTGPMEVIPEASSSALFNTKSPPPLKSPPKNTRAFLDAVEALKTSSVHSENDFYDSPNKGSNGSSIKRTTIIDAARERKRARDKKSNALYSTSDLKQIMESKSSITSRAEIFAEALAKRRTQ